MLCQTIVWCEYFHEIGPLSQTVSNNYGSSVSFARGQAFKCYALSLRVYVCFWCEKGKLLVNYSFQFGWFFFSSATFSFIRNLYGFE